MNQNPHLPVKPTTIPQARKYTREFKAASGKIFTEKDSIVIEIPPIANTYLTKEARVHFKFNFSFYDHNFTSTTSPFNYADYWKEWQTGGNNINAVNIQRKPVPMLEASGPYAFFRDVEVYDYLGNTLLEKVERHDLLSCIQADFGMEPELERLRPRIAEFMGSQILNTFTSTNNASPFANVFSLPAVDSRVNGVNLLDPLLNDYTANPVTRQQSDYYAYVVANPTVPATLVQVPTWQFSINLLNFLGSGSDHFVPLHNGYRIVLKTNPANVAVNFSLPSGGLNVPTAGTTPSEPIMMTIALIPQVTEYNFYDIVLRANLLEITPELDAQVDKVIRTKMNSYRLLGRCESPTIIPGNYLSVNNIKVSMRQLPRPQAATVNSRATTSSYSIMGFRSRTGVTKAKLLLNGAVQQEYTNVEQMRAALGTSFDTSITPAAFITDQPAIEVAGTGGYLYPFPSQNFRGTMAATATPANQAWALRDNRNLFYSRFNDQSGKFLLMFDLSLNGYNPNTITGIDTTKNTLTLELERPYYFQAAPFETDVFIEHDAIITIKPGEYSTVAF